MISKKEHKKLRADELLSRQQDIPVEESRKLILAGLVRVSQDRMVKNSSEMLEEQGTILILDESLKYVSRGAFKLKPSLDKYLPCLDGLVAADIGASTGGFTDLMLQYGAKKVYAIDVGYGQLHYKLRQDPRVINIERANARNISTNLIAEKIDIITMDLSFISVKKVLPNVNLLLKDKGWAFILVKPQFEARSSEVEKGGVVRDREVMQRCVSSISDFVVTELKWQVLESMPSALLGPKGNQEFILVCRK
ncbi:MAG: TlyA family RNA methyltransferase [Lentisphaerota bacterium]